MSLLRYPGGKKKLLAQIIPRIEAGMSGLAEYREPFFGGGSVGIAVLNRTLASRVWFNDKDDALAALWDSVANEASNLKTRVNAFVPSVETFLRFQEDLTQSPQGIQAAFRKLAVHQMSYSGLGTKAGGPIGGLSQTSAYGVGCRWSPSSLCRNIDCISKLFSSVQLPHGACTSLDFSALFEADEQVFLYVDPPYYDKGPDLYEHAFSETDHERLAKLLRETKHRWLLSYDECPRIRALYSWAHIEEIKCCYTITGARVKHELLICP